ncbi:MAG: phosphatidylserine decarboxylase [Chloroflexi bacterium]|nr:phosphatidylserine decarboxylase [Chloroflexota bacterium]
MTQLSENAPAGFRARLFPHGRAWREGTRPLLAFGALAVLGGLRRPALALPGIAAAATLLWLYRDPERPRPPRADMAYAPADGRVLAVRQVQDDHWNRRMWEIIIFLSLANVHIQRAPLAGRIEGERWIEGKRRPAMWPSASEHNARHDIYIQGAVPVTVTQVAGLVARAIVSWADPGATLAAGDRLGIIKLGSQTVLRVPADQAEVLVQEGDNVVGGVTPLARLRVAG